MADPAQKRFPFIDGLRGLAALAVVVSHASAVLSAGSRPGALADRLSNHMSLFTHGVDVFFVISGFVIAHSIADAKVDLRYAGRFALRRSLRLDPPYWAAILLTVTVLFVHSRIGKVHIDFPTAGQSLAHLAYAQRFFGFSQINPVFWTLCMEVQFYLIFVLLIWASDRVPPISRAVNPRRRAWVTAFAFLVSLIWVTDFVHVQEIYLWQGAVWCGPQWHKFLIGAIAWYAWRGFLPRQVAWIAIAILIVAIIAGPTRTLADGPKYDHSLWAGVATAVAFNIATITGGVSRWLRWRPLQFLGQISYSVYLVHLLVLDVVLGLQRRVSTGSFAGALTMFIGSLAASVAVGWLMCLAVERPSIYLASRFKLKHDDLAGGLEGPITISRPTP